MIFSSNFFLLKFLPVFLIIYFLSPQRLRNYVALGASLIFYVWGAPKFIFILLATLYLDFYLVRFISLTEGKLKKIFLAISVTINVGVLLFFKYFNFFLDNVNLLLQKTDHPTISFLEISLPIGISFITFHKITYAVDVFRQHHSPLKKISDYLLYIMMFPHQIAGPIVRYIEIADQLENNESKLNVDQQVKGIFRFIIGLSKKVLIANVMGNIADNIFSIPSGELSTANAWIGMIAYTFQIYFDFSGYSDMAIGLALMMGYVFPENFNFPYVSKSITEFWRRWHITLGRFMKDYLYIPLGGNRKSQARVYFNLWLVFLISGLWHGASWTFVVWGAYHGFLLILDRLFLLKLHEKSHQIFSIPLTFFLTMIGWVFFRASTMGQAYTYLKALFIFDFSNNLIALPSKFWFMLLAATIISFSPIYLQFLENLWKRLLKPIPPNFSFTLRGAFLLILLIVCISEISSSGFNPFIYYRF